MQKKGRACACQAQSRPFSCWSFRRELSVFRELLLNCRDASLLCVLRETGRGRGFRDCPGCRNASPRFHEVREGEGQGRDLPDLEPEACRLSNRIIESLAANYWVFSEKAICLLGSRAGNESCGVVSRGGVGVLSWVSGRRQRGRHRPKAAGGSPFAWPLTFLGWCDWPRS